MKFTKTERILEKSGWLSIKKHGLPKEECLCAIISMNRPFKYILSHFRLPDGIFLEHEWGKATSLDFPLHPTHYFVIPW